MRTIVGVPLPWTILFQILLSAASEIAKTGDLERQIEILVKQWSPLIWLSPEEKFMPSSVESFLENVNVADENGKIFDKSFSPATIFLKYSMNKSFYLVTKKSIDDLHNRTDSFIYGKNPREHSVPVYVIVNYCNYPAHPHYNQNNILNIISRSRKKSDINNYSTNTTLKKYFFHVSYWSFYPYNEGKDVCFLGKFPTPMIFSRCFGHFKKMGNHVGDWEHMSLIFSGKEYPERMFLAVHDEGVYYYYDPKIKLFKYESQIVRNGVGRNQPPKFPPFVRLQGGHPVLFSATGSHGLWASQGEHDFSRVPRLSDKNGYGTPWKTWGNLQFYHRGRTEMPAWLAFTGKWGNPKRNCLLSKKLGLCEFADGPDGLLRRKQDFYC